MRLALVMTLSLVLTACTSISPPPTPEAAQIRVVVPFSRADAYQRTAGAFVAEGLNIAQGSADGGTITTVPVDEAEMTPTTYRAAIIASDSSTIVIFSGSLKNNAGGLMAQAITGLKTESPDFPLHAAMKGDLAKAWQRLERVAQRLREQSSTEGHQ